MIAFTEGHKELIPLLLKAGADPNIKVTMENQP